MSLCDYVLSSSMIQFNQHSVLFFIVYTLLLYVPTWKSIFKISYMIFELYMCIEKYNLRIRGNARAFVLVLIKLKPSCVIERVL
jgi:hypothetical protein